MKEVLEILDLIADETSGASGSFYSPEAISPSIYSAFERFKEQTKLFEGERSIYVRLLLSELIILLSSARKEFISHNDEELGSKVARYINEHIEENISLDEVARKFFISKYYLCRLFKKYSGVSVHAYITQKRVLYAKQLIESGQTASGAAYKVGFGDYSAFYRAYVKQIGKTPTSK
jgi:AraC-like DNA-binding protein